MKKFRQPIDITGIIMPSNWDEDGRIIGTAIYTNTEEVHGLEHNSISRELLNLMHKRVEVKGRIREHPDGNKSIAVQNYIVLEDIVDDENKTT